MIPDFFIPTSLIPDQDFSLDLAERALLRRLAARVAELAAEPEQVEKRELWRRHNRLEALRPLVFCDPENSWHEILPEETLACRGPLARQWEFALRREIFWGEKMGDDRPLEPFFNVAVPYEKPFWGLRERRVGGQDGGSYVWDAPVKSEADFDRLRMPTIAADFTAADRLEGLASEIFDGLLTVRRRTSWWWTTGMTWTLVDLRGLQQVMFDMTDRPQFLHCLMALLRDGTLHLVEGLEQAGLLAPNWDGAYVGSGGLGYSDELPQPDFAGQVRMQDLWVLGESQETVGVSPRMFAEFVWPYQRPILERFGLVCYGCCEPLDTRWKVIRELPNLRRVSISPWADREKMAAALGSSYIFSMKPNPADLAMESFDPDRIRASLRRDLEVTRGCRVEVIMKDNHTIRRDPRRVVEWVRIAMQEAERIG